jgi:membrane protein implicated in regulation of membrane protease activity
MKKYQTYLKTVFISIFSFLALAFYPARTFAETEPDIKTSQTPYGQSVVITFPQNYSGEVSTSFDGTSWKTQTKKYTQADIEAMNKKALEQQRAIQKMIENQRKLFEQIWSSWPSFWF